MNDKIGNFVYDLEDECYYDKEHNKLTVELNGNVYSVKLEKKDEKNEFSITAFSFEEFLEKIERKLFNKKGNMLIQDLDNLEDKICYLSEAVKNLEDRIEDLENWR
jgi:hypothetical protein